MSLGWQDTGPVYGEYFDNLIDNLNTNCSLKMYFGRDPTCRQTAADYVRPQIGRSRPRRLWHTLGRGGV
jgi:hypothetical protein